VTGPLLLPGGSSGGSSPAEGDYSFGNFTATGETAWGAWEADPGENPDDSLRSANADKITQISNVITDGGITDGAITDGDIAPAGITEGDVTEGAIAEGASTSGNVIPGTRVSTGPITVNVNGKALS
jgi:hypothetical protein